MSREDRQDLAAELQILSPAEGKTGRRFRMVANTGAPVSRMFGQAIFELNGIELPKKIPILADHDPKLRVGFSETAELTDEGLVLEGPLLSNPNGKSFASDSDEGFPFQASVGLQVSQWLEVEAGDTAEVNGREVAGPISVAKKSRLLESSVLMAGADKETHAVALAAKQKEILMDPKAFEAAHPEAVAAWKSEAADAARVQQREELGVYLAAFPGREAWAQARFIAGDSLLEAKAALSDVLTVELAAVKAAPPAADPLLKVLAGGAPGVGFDGIAASGEPPTPTVLTLWQDPAIQGEFNGNHAAFLQAVSRGLVPELGVTG